MFFSLFHSGRERGGDGQHCAIWLGTDCFISRNHQDLCLVAVTTENNRGRYSSFYLRKALPDSPTDFLPIFSRTNGQEPACIFYSIKWCGGVA